MFSPALFLLLLALVPSPIAGGCILGTSVNPPTGSTTLHQAAIPGAPGGCVQLSNPYNSDGFSVTPYPTTGLLWSCGGIRQDVPGPNLNNTGVTINILTPIDGAGIAWRIHFSANLPSLVGNIQVTGRDGTLLLASTYTLPSGFNDNPYTLTCDSAIRSVRLTMTTNVTSAFYPWIGPLFMYMPAGSPVPSVQPAFAVSTVAMANTAGQTVYKLLAANTQTAMVWNNPAPPSWQDLGQTPLGVTPRGGFGLDQQMQYYTAPQAGFYHFDATALLQQAFSYSQPNQNVAIRLTAACNTTIPFACDCSQRALAQGGSDFLSAPVPSTVPLVAPPNGGDSAGAPNFGLTVSWTGRLPAGANVGVCVDNGTGQTLELLCTYNGLCTFGGFRVN